MGQVRCIRLITRAWKNRLYRLPPEKVYHVYILHVVSTSLRCQGISGVLVRLTTSKRLTKSLPELSLITPFPPETAG